MKHLSLALLIAGSVVAEDNTFSVDMRPSVGEEKNAHMMDRSITKRSSEK